MVLGIQSWLIKKKISQLGRPRNFYIWFCEIQKLRWNIKKRQNLTQMLRNVAKFREFLQFLCPCLVSVSMSMSMSVTVSVVVSMPWPCSCSRPLSVSKFSCKCLGSFFLFMLIFIFYVNFYVYIHGHAACSCSVDMHFNPKPHGSGPICPHFFQRPIIQIVLKCKKSAKNTYSTENVCWIYV